MILQLFLSSTIRPVIVAYFNLIKFESIAQLCALEAIFGDAVVILDRKGGQRCFQVQSFNSVFRSYSLYSRSKFVIC